MRRIRLCMVVFLLGLLCLQSPEARDSIEEVEGTGLVIRSDPSGARVYVDGIERGFTPLTLGNLPGGEYYIRLHKDDLLGVRYVDRRFKVTLHSTSRLVVSVDLEEAKGQVALLVKRSPGSPGEAELALEPQITVDGKTVDAPVLNIPAGYRTIRIRAFGWEEVSKTIYVEEGKNQLVEFELKPAPFVMSAAAVWRERFNPANSGSLGSANIVFTVSGPGRGTISIIDLQGKEVFAAETGPFTGWSQSLRWDGKSGGTPLKDGLYTVLIEAESISWDDSPPVRANARLSVELDSSLHIRPLTLSTGKAGLLFAALPETLPRYSLQAEGSLFFGRAPVTEKTWGTLPFSVAQRFSPMDRLEFAAALNVIPEFNADMSAAAGGSVKWLYWQGGALPLEAAAGLAFAWAEEGSVTPFGMGTGV
ncbi:MAG: PEGA domain-containing protein, partial [Treponema sp.]|nr:PEGA domain-containing protein [Treponema sp.]